MFAFVKNIEVEIYIEENPVTREVTFMDVVRENDKGTKHQEEVEEGVEYENESSDESLKDVHFDDIEEEKMKETDEGGLEEGVDEGVEAGLKQRVDVGHNDGVGDESSEQANKTFITNEMGKQHVIN